MERQCSSLRAFDNPAAFGHSIIQLPDIALLFCRFVDWIRRLTGNQLLFKSAAGSCQTTFSLQTKGFALLSLKKKLFRITVTDRFSLASNSVRQKMGPLLSAIFNAPSKKPASGAGSSKSGATIDITIRY
jgi:hypothetical protein